MKTFITNPTERNMTKKAVKKKAAPKKKSTKKEPEVNHKVIKTSKCQTVSGKSTITYNLGVDDGLFFIRILSNTGGGFYSNEWLAMDDITKLLSGIPKDRPITSMYLQPLFKNKSVNTPGFLLAALVNEKVLTRIENKKRHFAYTGKQPTTPKATKRKRRST